MSEQKNIWEKVSAIKTVDHAFNAMKALKELNKAIEKMGGSVNTTMHIEAHSGWTSASITLDFMNDPLQEYISRLPQQEGGNLQCID
jgi:predicted helicase